MSDNINPLLGQEPTRPARKSGRAVFAEDGRSSWEWQTSTGVFSRDVTDEQLSSLQAPQLQLVDADCEAVTLRRSQRPSGRVLLRAAATPVRPTKVGTLRRLLRRFGMLS
jgi:hypothetical protein